MSGLWWFSGRGVVWVGLDRCGPALPVPVCAWSVGLRGFGGEVEDPYARVRRGRCRYLGRTGVSACRCSRVPGGGRGHILTVDPDLAGARVYPGGGGWWVLHTCACCVSVGAAESCGTARSVAVMVLFPCVQAPLTAHGSPTTTRDAHRKSLQFQRRPAPTPQRSRSPVCNIEDNRTH